MADYIKKQNKKAERASKAADKAAEKGKLAKYKRKRSKAAVASEQAGAEKRLKNRYGGERSKEQRKEAGVRYKEKYDDNMADTKLSPARMNRYDKDMMHERELIHDAKGQIHKADKAYKKGDKGKKQEMIHDREMI